MAIETSRISDVIKRARATREFQEELEFKKATQPTLSKVLGMAGILYHVPNNLAPRYCIRTGELFYRPISNGAEGKGGDGLSLSGDDFHPSNVGNHFFFTPKKQGAGLSLQNPRDPLHLHLHTFSVFLYMGLERQYELCTAVCRDQRENTSCSEFHHPAV